MLRFLIQIAVYLVLGFAMFAATGLLSSREPTVVALCIGAAALWSASLTTFLERRGYPRRDPRERVAWGALLGALSVGGFTGTLSWLAWGRVDTVLVPLGALLGGAMQGARAFSIGAFRQGDANDDGADGEDADPAAGPQEKERKMNAKELIASGALVIDVRRKEEWDAGHLPMAKLVPIDDLDRHLADVAGWLQGDKSKPVVVYCAAGGRAGRAKALLEKNGFTTVVNGGGYSSLR